MVQRDNLTTPTKAKPYFGIRLSRKTTIPLPFVAVEESLELIGILQGQDRSYTCSDYLSSTKSANTVSTTELEHDVDIDCREKMIEWCYRVCDCGIFPPCEREMVAIAVSYLDRYMMNLGEQHSTACDRPTFKLAAVTSFYLATKIMSCMQIRIDSLVDLGRGSFDGNDIVEMEQTLLQGLKWKMNPPTIQCFIRHIWTLLPMSFRTTESMYYRAIFFAELAVFEYKFVTKDRYMIAVSCILNAIHYDFAVDPTKEVEVLLSMDSVERKGLNRIQSRLWYLYSCSAQVSEEDYVKPLIGVVVVPPKRTSLSPSNGISRQRNNEPIRVSRHSPVSVQGDDNGDSS